MKKQSVFNQRIQVMQALDGASAETVAANIQNAAIAIAASSTSTSPSNGKAVETDQGVQWDDAG